MKKLLDETTDDLTRSLLEAGRSHRPPATSQAQLLVALGVGSTISLLSSKAFAWLGTSSGKLTVLGVGVVGVGVAGALYSAALPPSEAPPAGIEQAAARLSPAAAAPTPTPFVPAHVADAPSDPGRDPVAGLPAVNEGPARRADAPAASESPHRTARVRKGSAVRRDDVRQRRQAEPEESRAAALRPVVPEPEERQRPGTEAELRAPGLESELQLVDAMRGAAQRNDTRALRGLVESYRGSFPHGQLRAEVAELALRTLPVSR